MAELDALAQALDAPAKPLLAIVAGSKVSTKLELLANLVGKVDQLIVGGGIANTFIAAAGYKSASRCTSRTCWTPRRRSPMPRRVAPTSRCRSTWSPPSSSCRRCCRSEAVDAVADDDLILDIGPQTAAQYAQLIGKAGTVVWNGPVGVFEFEAFSKGTEALARAIASSPAFSIAGGGDTLAAVDKFDIARQVSYISTGGGAFLEFLEGKTLPAVAALDARGA
jgi:phosphoglycerate kinase